MRRHQSVSLTPHIGAARERAFEHANLRFRIKHEVPIFQSVPQPDRQGIDRCLFLVGSTYAKLEPSSATLQRWCGQPAVEASLHQFDHHQEAGHRGSQEEEISRGGPDEAQQGPHGGEG